MSVKKVCKERQIHSHPSIIPWDQVAENVKDRTMDECKREFSVRQARKMIQKNTTVLADVDTRTKSLSRQRDVLIEELAKLDVPTGTTANSAISKSLTLHSKTATLTLNSKELMSVCNPKALTHAIRAFYF